MRFFRSLLNSKSDMLDPDIPKRLPQQPVVSPRDRAHGGGDCHSDEGNGKRESSGAGRASRRTAETRTSTRPDHPAGVPPTHHPHLARGESPTAVE